MEKGAVIRMMYIFIFALASFCIAFTFNATVRNAVRSTNMYWYLADKVATPLMRRADPEKAHTLAIKMIQNKLSPLEARHDAQQDKQILETTVLGLNFTNPLGVAAGLDKQAQAMRGLLDMGFGFVEVGGVTPEPQPGNPQPRMFRLREDGAIINRYGLNSDGQAVLAKRLAAFKAQAKPGIVGVNIAKNTSSEDVIGDYKKGVRNLGANVDFIVLNVSCPNVGWTKELSKDSAEMVKMVCAVKEERDALFGNGLNNKPALLMKLAPDMDAATKQHMAEVAIQCGVDGLIVSNTTSDRSPDLKSKYSIEKGGLSGRPIKQAALQSVRDMYRLTGGKIPIIGVGGIESGADAYARIRAGASLLQVYTALVYQGPGLVPKVKHDLAELLRRDGFTSVADAVGVDAGIYN